MSKLGPARPTVILIAATVAAVGCGTSSIVTVAPSLPSCSDLVRALGPAPCVSEKFQFSGEAHGAAEKALLLRGCSGMRGRAVDESRYQLLLGTRHYLLTITPNERQSFDGSALRQTIGSPQDAVFAEGNLASLDLIYQKNGVEGEEWLADHGTLEIAADGVSGSVDSVLQRRGVAGTGVHITGKWSCAIPRTTSPSTVAPTHSDLAGQIAFRGQSDFAGQWDFLGERGFVSKISGAPAPL